MDGLLVLLMQLSCTTISTKDLGSLRAEALDFSPMPFAHLMQTSYVNCPLQVSVARPSVNRQVRPRALFDWKAAEKHMVLCRQASLTAQNSISIRCNMLLSTKRWRLVSSYLTLGFQQLVLNLPAMRHWLPDSSCSKSNMKCHISFKKFLSLVLGCCLVVIILRASFRLGSNKIGTIFYMSGDKNIQGRQAPPWLLISLRFKFINFIWEGSDCEVLGIKIIVSCINGVHVHARWRWNWKYARIPSQSQRWSDSPLYLPLHSIEWVCLLKKYGVVRLCVNPIFLSGRMKKRESTLILQRSKRT